MYKALAEGTAKEYLMTLSPSERDRKIEKVFKHYAHCKKPKLMQWHYNVMYGAPEIIETIKTITLEPTLSIESDNKLHIGTYEIEIDGDFCISFDKNKIMIECKGESSSEVQDQITDILKQSNPRARRSRLWNLYRYQCQLKGEEPKIRYPKGNDREYIRLINEL